MNTNYYTTLDTATIDRVPLTVEHVEQPLDFEALKKAVRMLPPMYRWPGDTDRHEAGVVVQKALPRLIDMAERCEAWKTQSVNLGTKLTYAEQHYQEQDAEIKRLSVKCGALAVERDQAANKAKCLQTAHATRRTPRYWHQRCQEVVAERARLKEQLAEAVAAREYAEQQLAAIETQPSGLSEEDRRYMESFLGWEDSAPASAEGINHLLAIIDRLSRQKVAPWKKTAHIEKSGYYFWGNARGHNWGYLNAKDKCDEAIYHVSFDDVLNTLPKGDATP